MLEVSHVTKRFEHFNAVSDLSFQIKPGEILSLIGQNGAGKSTTFHMILNFIEPSEGKILWNHKPISKVKHNLSIGYMPEERGLYPKESIKSQIDYFAALHGMGRFDAEELLDQWMKKLNVVGKPSSKIESLSKGNAQKVQLIACLMFKPDLLILDEPFSGLDPVNAQLLINAILEAKNNGCCIIFSTHNMENVEKLSDYIVMLNHGQTVLKGFPQEIYKHFGRIKLDIEGYKYLNNLRQFNGIRNFRIKNETAHITLDNQENGKFIFKKVTSDGYIPVFNQHYPSLDEIFKWEVKNNNK
ncbi:ABC transporter ATP-binding protein [Philodulcilactobacillus myokoensis]|uniref:ABC transporter ATP-binding protein n=1 Tax=Philodulcilactobacillus myokoensis TaxID=2929573 RepID=A0A9W6B3N2_9LACO|nr:ATP-binding cassette domain-containing protein [Philodulcilactobacillus myokoensis]GLB47505.1 ABC transporter ATP-binding protein [Philodulcilactobacillus myokoensis]